MFENPSLLSDDRCQGDCAGVSGIAVSGCATPEQMAPRLQKASEFFVASLSRPGVELADAVDVWLGKSPCHQCAWRQVRAAWDGLAQIRA
jgi:hypothetical protein